MSLTTLSNELYARLGVPATDSFYTSAKVTQFLNSALQYITAQGDWEWLEKSETIPTVSGTDTYTVATDSLRTIDVSDPSGVPLMRKDIDDLEYMPGGAGQSGYVRFFSPYKNTLVVRPVPNVIISLKHRYVTSEPFLVAGGDIPLMPVQWQEAVIERACYLAEMAIGNTPQATATDAVVQGWIATMLRRADRRAISEGGGEPTPAPKTPTGAPVPS